MTSFRPAIAVLGAIAIFIAIATVVMALTTTQRGGSMGLLVDVSHPSHGSTKREIVACAKQAARRAVDDGAALTIAPVAGSLVHMTAPTIKSKLSLNERLTLTRAKKVQKRARAMAAARITAVRRSRIRRDSSDTIAATAIMGRILRLQPAPRTLVVCGDAHQVSHGFNMYRERLTARRSRQLLKRVAPDLGKLSGMDVIFGASGLDTTVALSNAREEAIARWWTDYWAPAVGLQAHRFRYGSTLHFPSDS